MQLTRVDLRGQREPFGALLPRPVDAGADVRDAVEAILEQVRSQGDEALVALTTRFDGVTPSELRVSDVEIRGALGRISPSLRMALEIAHERIRAYHAHDAGIGPHEGGAATTPFVSEGVVIRDLVRPVSRAGCYAPGGRARYPSTVLMCATPARVAGVDEVVLCVPPGPGGRIDDASLAAAAVAGVDEVYCVGGAQAIGAMAYGTESIERVDVIVGPGNTYVAEAKRQVSGVVGIASAFAGPSEVVVVAGPQTPATLAAIDLAVQAEHGPDGVAWLVTWSHHKAEEIEDELADIVAASPRRRDLESSLGANGYVCLVDNPAAAIAAANVIAPEHLELMIDDAEALLPLVRSAGAVFCGVSAPASFGDYLAGPNHVLPTNRSARFSSALRATDFLRHIHAVSVTPGALATLGPHVVQLAESEGLDAHAESIRARV
jgi:histidinol dehydrogenase